MELTEHGWQPKVEAVRWVRELRDKSVKAGVAFFHKQWGGPRPTSGGRLVDGRVWSEYPTDVPSTLVQGLRPLRETAHR